jgi:hypothetical protein
VTTQAVPIQPQDRRPAKSAQRAKARKQAEKDKQMFGIRVDGRDYILNPHDVTGAAEYLIRKELGMGLSELADKTKASPGFDYVGMFLWAVRVAKGERDLDLMEVLEEISGGSVIEEIEVEVGPKA